MNDTITYKVCRNRVHCEDMILTVITERCNNDSRVSQYPLHTHRYTEAFFCKEHTINVVVEDRTITVPKGNILLVPGGIRHHVSPSNPYTDFSAVGILLEQVICSGDCHLYPRMAGVLDCSGICMIDNGEMLFRFLEQLLMSHDNLSNLEMTARILRNISDYKKQDIDVSNSAWDTDSQNTLMKFDTILSTCFDQKLTLETIAEQLHISKRQLSRIAQAHYGKTVKQLITDIRLETAEKMLTETSYPIEKLAAESGFCSKSAFYRDFSKKYGQNPTQYRKKLKTPVC